MGATQTINLDKLYELGDVYDALDAVNELDTKIARLQRMRLMSEPELSEVRRDIEQIRERLERRLSAA